MRTLILGDGLLGSELQKQTGWDIISRKKDGLDINNPDSYINTVIEFIDDKLYGRLGYALNYDTIINCTAQTDSYSNDPSKHLEVNYEAVAKLTKFCNKYGIKLVHISTEFVYANNSTPPSEEDIPLPIHTWYGCSKLLGDMYVQQHSSNFLLCRLLHKDVNLEYENVWNVKTSGDTVDKIARIVIELISKNAVGTFNVGTGDKPLTDIIKAHKIISAPEGVPIDTTMNLDKLNEFLK